MSKTVLVTLYSALCTLSALLEVLADSGSDVVRQVEIRDWYPGARHWACAGTVDNRHCVCMGVLLVSAVM